MIKDTATYKCLQSQFSVLYKEAQEMKSQTEDARALLQQTKKTHLRQIEQMEVNTMNCVFYDVCSNNYYWAVNFVWHMLQSKTFIPLSICVHSVDKLNSLLQSWTKHYPNLKPWHSIATHTLPYIFLANYSPEQMSEEYICWIIWFANQNITF